MLRKANQSTQNEVGLKTKIKKKKKKRERERIWGQEPVP